MANKLLAFFTVIIAFSRSSILEDAIPASLFYAWFVMITFISLIRNSASRKINLLMLLFLLVCFVSIAFNEIDDDFMPWQRFLGFLFFITAIGPFLEDRKSIEIRAIMFKYANFLMICITFISFIGFSIRSSLFFNYSGFAGLTNQSMVLGPIAGFSTITSLDSFFSSQKKNQRFIFLALTIISFLVCLLAASRGALLSLLISALFLIIVLLKNAKKKLLKIVVIATISFLATSSFWFTYAEMLILKNESRIETGDVLSGRENMWIDRIDDFKSSPLYGVGFSSMKHTNNSNIKSSGAFEPGSSWLFLLSTLGILGIILFVLLFIRPIIRILGSNVGTAYHYPLIGSVLVFFSIHLLIEGYVISTGGFLSFFLWLSISNAQKRPMRFLKNMKTVYSRNKDFCFTSTARIVELTDEPDLTKG